MFGDVLWVLVVIVWWLFVASIVLFLTRFVAHERDDEQTVCELPEGYLAEQPALSSAVSAI